MWMVLGSVAVWVLIAMIVGAYLGRAIQNAEFKDSAQRSDVGESIRNIGEYSRRSASW